MVALVTMFAHDPEQERKTREFVHHHRAWFVLLGAALVGLGIIAAASSVTMTFASMLFLSGVLLAGGVIRVISAFTARDWSGSLLLALSGALYVVSGVLTFRHPGHRSTRADPSVRSLVPRRRAVSRDHRHLVPLSQLGMGCSERRR